MSIELPAWLSRVCALTLSVAVLAAIYVIVVAPLTGAHARVDEAIEETRDLLSRYQRMARSRPQLQAQLEELAQRQAESGMYLRGETDPLAAAELQERVNTAIDASGGALTSTQALPVTEADGFRRVAVSVQFTGTTEALQRAIYALEADKPLLQIDNVDVRSRAARRRAAEDAGNPALIVRFDLYGYRRPGPG